jgi:hypothetical protein
MERGVPAKWLLLETTAYVELESPMTRKLQVVLPELLVVKFRHFAETMDGLSLVIAMLCFRSCVSHFVLQTKQTHVLRGVLWPMLSVLLSPPFSCLCVCVYTLTHAHTHTHIPFNKTLNPHF